MLSINCFLNLEQKYASSFLCSRCLYLILRTPAPNMIVIVEMKIKRKVLGTCGLGLAHIVVFCRHLWTANVTTVYTRVCQSHG